MDTKVAMKNISHFILVSSIILQIGCNESEISEDLTEPYIGTWRIYQVIKDGELQSEWGNTTLTLEQTGQVGGLYELPQTPYDTVWYSTGTWKSVDDHSFLLNDSIIVNYELINDSLYLTKFLPWTSIPCDPNDPDTDGCLTVVTGQWDFSLAPID